ncbi:hypothetical protein MTE1_4765 [Klebsiella pneumoniae JHCK1]|nr:hypothetical protein MTE1_4765 [Klebsiella pneumoniae JHCK1]
MLSIVQVIKRGLSSPNCCFARLAKNFFKAQHPHQGIR